MMICSRSKLPCSRLPMFTSRPLPPKYVPQFLPNLVHWVQRLKNQTILFDHLQNLFFQNLKYTSNLARVVDTIHHTQHVVFTSPSKNQKMILINISKKTIYLPKNALQSLLICHQTSITFEPLSSKNRSSTSPHLTSNINHILILSNRSYPYIININSHCALNG